MSLAIIFTYCRCHFVPLVPLCSRVHANSSRISVSIDLCVTKLSLLCISPLSLRVRFGSDSRQTSTNASLIKTYILFKNSFIMLSNNTSFPKKYLSKRVKDTSSVYRYRIWHYIIKMTFAERRFRNITVNSCGRLILVQHNRALEKEMSRYRQTLLNWHGFHIYVYIQFNVQICSVFIINLLHLLFGKENVCDQNVIVIGATKRHLF